MAEKVRVSGRDIIQAVAGTIYAMHPYHAPEGMDKIMANLVKVIDETPDVSGRVDDTFKLFEFETWRALEDWIENVLKQTPEYEDLNVSRQLKERGVKASDPENSGFAFHTRYDKSNLDSRYTDFVDLGALIRNIVRAIDTSQQMDEDCFLCKFAKEYGSMEPSESEQCKHCLCHPDVRFNRETHPMALKPHNEWTEEEKEKYMIS